VAEDIKQNAKAIVDKGALLLKESELESQFSVVFEAIKRRRKAKSIK
jgi:UDP-N-acetylglucosamine--N-acetylmuramyl-(pentapeptide) pyrophosphoryl-undecaprenol N-acetylglucosamine transferase